MTRKGVTAYDVADHYDDSYFADLAERYRVRSRFARRRIANVLKLLPADLAGLQVLDLGCGMGTFAIEAARLGARATGIDPAPAAVSAALQVAHGERSQASFVQADAAALPVASGSADVVLAADVTEHLDDATLALVLGEAFRALRTGGRMVLYTPERRHLFERLRERGVLSADESHIGLRSARELTAATSRAGFLVQSVEYLPSHLPGWNLLEQAFARWVSLLRRRIGLVAVKP